MACVTKVACRVARAKYYEACWIRPLRPEHVLVCNADASSRHAQRTAVAVGLFG